MNDPRRLGRKGAYRLGELESPGKPVPGLRARGHPSLRARPSPGSSARCLDGWWTAVAILGLGAAFGLWFLPFVAGILAGFVPWRLRSALGLVVLAVCVGWGAALAWPALFGAQAGATARAVAALAGLPPYAGVGVAGTLLIGVLQAVVAVWLPPRRAHTPPE